MRIVITGGGTGGHISPALAIAEELRRRDPQLLLMWIGKKGGMEERAAKSHAIPFRGLAVAGWPRKKSPAMLSAGLRLAWSCLRAYLYLRSFKPDAVIGAGGYASLPALLAAQRLGVPTFLHEQNKRLGLANRLAAPKATRLFLSYPDTEGDYPRDRALLTGNPVRDAFVHPPSKADSCGRFGLDPEVPVVLVVGGSQGATSLNDAVVNLIKDGAALPPLQVLWMTGKSGEAKAQAAAAQAALTVQVHPYIEDMAAACAAADLLVSRAGASSTAEIAVLGKPAILIPYPHATDNHQEMNARAFEAAGAARVLLDRDCKAPTLGAQISALLGDAEALRQMAQAARSLAQPLAVEHIADEILENLFAK